MAESRDYDELLFAWKGWRDSAGKVLRNDYKRYVELANAAAKLNGMTLKNNFTSTLRFSLTQSELLPVDTLCSSHSVKLNIFSVQLHKGC